RAGGVHAVGEAGAELGPIAAERADGEGIAVAALAAHDENVVVGGSEVVVRVEVLERELAEEASALTAAHVAVGLAVLARADRDLLREEDDRSVGLLRTVVGAQRAARAVVEDRAAGDAHALLGAADHAAVVDRKSTRLNSSHVKSSYAVFCL